MLKKERIIFQMHNHNHVDPYKWSTKYCLQIHTTLQLLIEKYNYIPSIVDLYITTQRICTLICVRKKKKTYIEKVP